MNTANSGKVKKTAILFGSPNNQGNTAKLLDEFLRHCPENGQASLLCAYDLKILPCIGCDRCRMAGRCVHHGKDDFEKIGQMIEESDLFIIASPIYFLNLPAPLKQIFDRFQSYFYQRPFANRPVRKAVLLTTSGSGDSAGPEQTALTVKYALDAVNVSLVETVAVKNTDRHLEIDPELCKKAAQKLFCSN